MSHYSSTESRRSRDEIVAEIDKLQQRLEELLTHAPELRNRVGKVAISEPVMCNWMDPQLLD